MLEAQEDCFQYLTQDFCWNASDGNFVLSLHADVFTPADVPSDIQYQRDANAEIAIFQSPYKSAIVHCRCKQGNATQDLRVRFESATRLSLSWPGVTRIFARVRIMDPTDTDSIISILRGEVEGGFSPSDVEHPDENQSHRPWSDQDDSETETLDGEPEQDQDP